MNKLQHLEKLDRAIRDGEFRLKSIQYTLEKVQQEINALTPLVDHLEQNLDFLKKSETIPIAHEYRKVKEELSKSKKRLSDIKKDFALGSKGVEELIAIIAKFKKEQSDLIAACENNVVKGSFGGSNGKK